MADASEIRFSARLHGRAILVAALLLLTVQAGPLSLGAAAQVSDDDMRALIAEVNLDSLQAAVRALSGEIEVDVGGWSQLIGNRRSPLPGNDLAAAWISERLQRLGLYVQRDPYSDGGMNVLGWQYGTSHPERILIVCAHYDAVPDYAADDNASGTAAVLEAARLLSHRQFPCTVLYALWDEEELGLAGSGSYSSRARLDGSQIVGVLNLEMFGWDSDNDMRCEIHVRDVAASTDLAASMVSVNQRFTVGLDPRIVMPGITASDHAPFWQDGFSALMLIQAYSYGDRNPYYHTPGDRLNVFNQTYFLRLARLSVATLAWLAAGGVPLDAGAAALAEQPYLGDAWPNPASSSAKISLRLPSAAFVDAVLYDGLGRRVRILASGPRRPGRHVLEFTREDLPDGLYYCRVRAGGAVMTRRVLFMR